MNGHEIGAHREPASPQFCGVAAGILVFADAGCFDG
jgi:hypothetical protein